MMSGSLLLWVSPLGSRIAVQTLLCALGTAMLRVPGVGASRKSDVVM